MSDVGAPRTMSDDQLEAAAKAIRASWTGRPWVEGSPWDQLPEHTKNNYRQLARAAFDAVPVLTDTDDEGGQHG